LIIRAKRLSEAINNQFTGLRSKPLLRCIIWYLSY